MKKELVLNFILTLIISIIMFLQNKYFIQYIGLETLGIMKLFNQLLQYLNIVELGLGTASTFALYKPLAERNKKEISIIISTIESIYNKIAILLFVLGILVLPVLPYFIKIDNFTKNIYFYWIFYVINTISTYLYIKYIILFTANQEFIYVRIIQSISKIFYQILQIIFIIKYKSFLLFIILLLLDNLTQYILFKIHYRKYYSYIKSTKERYKGLNRDIKNLFWHKIGGLVVFNTDLILISKFISLEIVGVYASYQLIIQMINTIISIIVNVLRPKLGRYISLNSKKDIYLLFKKLNICFLILALIFSYGTFILINDFIKLWLRGNIILPNKTIALICINIFISIFRQNIDIFKEGSGFFDDIYSPILESIINLIFSIGLGLKYGLNGIIIGTIISNMFVIIGYRVVLTFKNCFDCSFKEYIKVYGEYGILIVILLHILNKITIFFVKNINNWIEWIIQAIIISTVTTVVISMILLLNKDFRDIIRYVLKKQPK